jgi:hypothetical protein
LFFTNNTERMRIVSPVNIGGYGGLTLNGTTGSIFSLMTNGTETTRFVGIGNETSIQCAATTGFISFVQGLSGGTERARIDASGNLLVGKTSLDSSVVGFEAESDGKIAATRDGARTAIFNRLTSDGEIVDFRKDGTTVGSIGLLAVIYLFIALKQVTAGCVLEKPTPSQ